MKNLFTKIGIFLSTKILPFFKTALDYIKLYAKKVGKFLFEWVWQLPQNALGYGMSRLWKERLIVLSQRELKFLYGMEELTGFKIYVADYCSHKNDKILGNVSGFSMGKYICLNTAHDLYTIRHEKGHKIGQSETLGWLYLPTVGVYSSVFCNMWDRWFHVAWCIYDRHYWYYKTRWSEKQADEAGGVDRNAALRKLALTDRPENAKYPLV